MFSYFRAFVVYLLIRNNAPNKEAFLPAEYGGRTAKCQDNIGPNFSKHYDLHTNQINFAVIRKEQVE